MSENLEQRYQESGFELVVYRQRQPDPYRTCKKCGRNLFHIATTFDEWGEAQSTSALYHFCKHCKTVEQLITRQQPSGTSVQQLVVNRAPYMLLVELLATARHQNGRNITVLTINRHWWSAWRYRLVMGALLGPDAPRVRPLGIPGKSSNILVDQEALSVTPIPRYNPHQVEHNPFKSRRVKRPDEITEDGETTETTPDDWENPNSVEDES